MMGDFPDKVGHLKDGWAVRFAGKLEAARWQTRGAAEIHLELLKAGYRKPQPGPVVAGQR